MKILDKTNAIVSEFEAERKVKRSENFDTAAYFKLLDNLSHSGLPVESSVVEDARLELKREKWIKKYNDLQQIGFTNNAAASVSQHDSQSVHTITTSHAPGQAGSISIKKLEALSKEFQVSQEL